MNDKVINALIEKVNSLTEEVKNLKRLELKRVSKLNIGLSGSEAATDNLIVDGQIGIGASPSVQLHIKGTGNQELDVESTDSNIAIVKVKSVQGWNIETGRSGSSNFQIWQDGTGARLIIDTSGNVGIGGSPSYNLDIQNASGAINLAMRASSDQSIKFWEDSGQQWDIYHNTTTNGIGFYDRTAGVYALRILDGSSGAITLGSSRDVYTDAYQDWTSFATIVGFSGTPGGSIYYKKIGKLVFVRFSLSGTGNNTAMSFTLPYNKVNDGTTTEWKMRAQDAGTWLNGAGMGRIANASPGLAVFYTSEALAAWTASGNRQLYGQFWYEAA